MRWIMVAGCGWVGCSGGDGIDPTDSGLPTGSSSTVVGDLIGEGAPVTPDWQILWGHDSSGASFDGEGTIDLIELDDQPVVLADRRYGDDSFGRTLPLVAVASDGSGAAAQLVQNTRNLTPRGIAAAPGGDVYLVVEDDPVVARIGAKGELRWVHRLGRDPYAFGGMSVFDVAGHDGDLYIAGAFNPSEAADERGFVARIDSDGAVVWVRSWVHDTFAETTRLAVGAAGVCVADRVPDNNEFNTHRMVYGFDPDGAPLGQASLRRATHDGPAPAVFSVAVAATDDGCEVVGTRTNAVDKNFGLYVYRIAFDLGGGLALTERSGTWIPLTDSYSAIGMSLTRHASGALTAGLTLADRPALLHFDGEGPARLFHIEGTGGGGPAQDDEDYRTHVLARAAGAVVVAATAEAPGAVQLTPYDAAPAELALAIEDPGFSIESDAVTATDAKKAWTVVDDTLGMVDEAREGDEDVWLLQVTP